MDKVLFYYNDSYCLNNFSAHKVKYKGVLYQTAEHAYQCQKFTDKKIRDLIKKAASSLLAKEIANKNKEKFRPDWHKIKVSVMKKIVAEKIRQHKEVKIALLKTGNKELVENSPTDSFWGWGKDHQGENQMGKILMELRDKLQKHTL